MGRACCCPVRPSQRVVEQGITWTLTVEEAAKLRGISRTLAYELVNRHVLPSVRLGRRIVVPRKALEDFLGGSA